MIKDEMNKQLLQQVDSLTSTVDSLNATINAQSIQLLPNRGRCQRLSEIMSYVGTAHRQGYNAYEVIKNAIVGHLDFIFE